jgi:hypothetical protein
LYCARSRCREHPEGHYCLNIGGKWITIGESSVEAASGKGTRRHASTPPLAAGAIANAPVAAAETISDAIADYMDEFRIGTLKFIGTGKDRWKVPEYDRGTSGD